jgi:hypothetical protein
MFGEGEKALEYYLSICPSAKKDHDVYRSEPYVYAQMTASQFSPTPGEGKNSWLTGTAAWSFVVASQYDPRRPARLHRPAHRSVHSEEMEGLHGHPQVPRRHLHHRGEKPEGEVEGREVARRRRREDRRQRHPAPDRRTHRRQGRGHARRLSRQTSKLKIFPLMQFGHFDDPPRSTSSRVPTRPARGAIISVRSSTARSSPTTPAATASTSASTAASCAAAPTRCRWTSPAAISTCATTTAATTGPSWQPVGKPLTQIQEHLPPWHRLHDHRFALCRHRDRIDLLRAARPALRVLAPPKVTNRSKRRASSRSSPTASSPAVGTCPTTSRTSSTRSSSSRPRHARRHSRHGLAPVHQVRSR